MCTFGMHVCTSFVVLLVARYVPCGIACVQVLNRIIPFAGIPGAEKFTAEMVNDKHGFPGNYNTTQFTANETAALAMLREFFRKPQEDLKELVDAVWPEAEFRIEYET